MRETGYIQEEAERRAIWQKCIETIERQYRFRNDKLEMMLTESGQDLLEVPQEDLEAAPAYARLNALAYRRASGQKFQCE